MLSKTVKINLAVGTFIISDVYHNNTQKTDRDMKNIQNMSTRQINIREDGHRNLNVKIILSYVIWHTETFIK